MFRSHLKKYAAVGVLHTQEKVQFKADFFLKAVHLEPVRSNKRFLRIDCLIFQAFASTIANQFAGKQEGCYRDATVHNILAIITGIVPATMGIPGAFAMHARVESDVVV